MAGRTVVIASHAVNFLAPLAAQAIFLDEGHIVWSGPGPDLLVSPYMAPLVQAATITGFRGNSTQQHMITNSSAKDIMVTNGIQFKDALPKTPRQLIGEEYRASGEVGMQHWQNLRRNNGNLAFWAGLVALVILLTGLPVLERNVLRLVLK